MPTPIAKSWGGRVPPQKTWVKPADWEKRTGALWAKNHQEQIAAAAMPKMKSAQAIQAEANAAAWKAVHKMVDSLPTFGTVDAPFTAQRNAIQPLVDSHANWLLQAGDYQTKMSNGLAQLAQQTGAAADTQQAAGAASAGAPAGSPGFGGNVSPADMSSGIAGGGGSTANYLMALGKTLPQALGAASRDEITRNENTALQNVADARKEATGQFSDLYDKTFSGLNESYFDKFKSELAALSAGQKGDLERSKLALKARTDAANLDIKRQNAATASSRVSSSTAAAATAAAAKLAKEDRDRLASATLHARETYQKLGGVKVPGSTVAADTKQTSPMAYTTTIKLVYPPGNSIEPGQKPKEIPLYASSPEELASKINQYISGHQATKTDSAGLPLPPEKQGHYDKGTIVKGPGYVKPSSSRSGQVTKDAPSESTRRLRAWRTFKAEMQAATTQLTESQLQALFRTQFGDPAK